MVEEQLSEVQPLIDSACAAVGSIKAENISELRSFKMPPDAIRDVLEGVLLLMGREVRPNPTCILFAYAIGIIFGCVATGLVVRLFGGRTSGAFASAAARGRLCNRLRSSH